MQEHKRDPSPTGLPRPLIYSAALTCGVLAAMALQIQLGRAGFDLVVTDQPGQDRQPCRIRRGPFPRPEGIGAQVEDRP